MAGPRPLVRPAAFPLRFSIFCLTEKLGQLDRGASIELSPYECALLDQILDAACQNERLGKGPHQSAEVIAAMIKRVAFDNAAPEEWARNLYFGVIGGQGWSVRRQPVSIERGG